MKNQKAFPEVDRLIDRGVGGRIFDVESIGGMTLLDYFAGQVLMGICTHTNIESGTLLEDLAKDAYELAEAMLKEREKHNDKT